MRPQLSNLDQWQFLAVLLAAEVNISRDKWIQAFKDVNLHPMHVLSVDDFCKIPRVQQAITAEEAYGKYAPLTVAKIVEKLEPLFLASMPVVHKASLLKYTAGLFGESEDWDKTVVSRLDTDYGVKGRINVTKLMAYTNALHVLATNKNPDPYYCAAGSQSTSTTPPLLAPSTMPTSGLQSYTLHPSTITSNTVQHFNHLISCRKRAGVTLDSVVPYDLAVGYDQRRFLDPSRADISLGGIMKLSADVTIGRKMGSRTLNVLGESQGACLNSNSLDRLARMRQAASLSSTLESMAEAKKKEKQQLKVSSQHPCLEHWQKKTC